MTRFKKDSAQGGALKFNSLCLVDNIQNRSSDEDGLSEEKPLTD